MKIGKDDAIKIEIDERTLVEEYVTSDLSDKLSLAVIHIMEDHKANPNVKSDKILFVISGKGLIQFGGDEHSLGVGDCFFVPKNEGFKINGNIAYISVASPPYNPKDEEI